MNKKRSIKFYLVFFLVAVFFLTINLVNLTSAYNFGSALESSITIESDKVAYIYNQDFKIDDNIVALLNEKGLEVEPLKYTQISRTDLSQYKFIFINDEKFPMSYVSKIPVKDYNSVVINYNHGKVWGLTDSDGISKLAASEPLSALVLEDSREYEVYTQGFYKEGSTVAIPLYYLSDKNKANSFMSVAITIDEQTGNEGDVISYMNESSRLVNGQITNGKMCFFGIAKSDYWTPKSKELFTDCITFVASECSKDSDCTDEATSGDNYCINDSVYRDTLSYSCLNPGELNAECIATAIPEFVEECPNACFEGACVECNIDSDCDDANNYTYDFCENHFCGHQPINCTYDTDCSDSDLYTYDQCMNPGTVDSYCNYTSITCVYDTDCGISSLIGNPFCLNDNLYMLFENVTCQNPGMLDSYCSYINESVMNRTCLFGCSGDICFECTINAHCDDNNSATFDYCSNNTCYHSFIQCNNDSECNDGNSSTIDQCQNPGTINSQCIHTPINCASDADCGMTGFIGSEFCSSNDVFKIYKNSTCVNPGTVNSNCVVTQQQILINDCGQDSCTNTGEPYCYDGDVYQIKTCTVNSCINDTISHCSSTSYENATIITDCLYGCSGGVCTTPQIECSSNADCNDGNSYTQDVCMNPGTQNSYCVHNPLQCISDIDCGVDGYSGSNFCSNGDVYRNYIDYSCVGNSCHSNNENRLIQDCLYGCSGGVCNVPECTQDSDCGVDGYSGSNFCSNGDVYRNYIDYSCVGNSCHSNNENRLIQDCLYGCSGGVCIAPVPVCGNGIKEGGEQCDDGNLANGDGCSSSCLLEGYCYEICSGGLIDFELSIDRSGSMNTFLDPPADSPFSKVVKIAAARNAARTLVSEALERNSETKIGISTFSTDVVNEVDLSNSFSLLSNKINHIYANGNHDTNYKDSIMYAVDKLNNQGGIGDPKIIVFLSDGTPTVVNTTDSSGTFVDARDLQSAIDAANYAKINNVILITIGFGKKSELNEELLKDMAEITGGAYFFAGTEKEIMDIYGNIGNRTCEIICINQTIPITCSSNADCNDGNSYTQDVCMNPGTQNSYCVHNPLQCISDIDCGVDGYSGSNFCSNGDVYRNYIDYSCVGNSCHSNNENRLIQDCLYGCSGGICTTPQIECSSNADCNDGNSLTYDQCVNPGTQNSYCIHGWINCAQNSDCGITGYIGSNFCSNGDVYRQYQTSNCENPGTLLSSCSITVENRFIQDCLFGCSGGVCTTPQIECSSNADCNDGNSYTQDVCMNPGTQNSYCVHNPLQCISDIDCGVDGYSGSNFCSNGDVYRNYIDYSCVGNSCHSNNENRLIQDCLYGCSGGVCIVPECTQDSDCGVDGYSGSNFCSNGDVYRNYIDYSCVGNSCHSNNENRLIQDCLFGCNNGVCTTPQIECSSNADCNDGDSYTQDVCMNPGTQNSYCVHNPLQCIGDIDCGVDGYSGSNFCSNGDVYRNYIDYSCVGNSCHSNNENRLIQDCLYGCSGGVCTTPQIECSSNADCNDGEELTYDQCVNPGTPSSYCTNTQISCAQNSDCGITGYIGSNFCSINDLFRVFQTATCENPGQLTSNCIIINENRLITDCGEDSCDYIGTPYCSNGDVYQTRRCIDRGCSASSCSATTTDTNVKVQDCLYGCSNGVCSIPECTQDSDCDDGNPRTVDQCLGNSCIHTEVDCLFDLDCGTTGFIGNNFCLTNDLYRLFQTATCENPGTLQSNCVISQENRLIEDCAFICSDNQCTIPPQCSDGIDNDNDGFIDYPADSGCISMLDDSEANVIPITYQCNDGLDNDGDGLVDYPNDPGCSNSNDNDETNAPLFPKCADGIDNDHDGFIDYPADSGCISMLDNSE